MLKNIQKEPHVLAARLNPAGVNCMNGNESKQAADARVPLQFQSHQYIPPTENLRNVWHPGDGDRPSLYHMPPARAIVKQTKTILQYNTKVVYCHSQ